MASVEEKQSIIPVHSSDWSTRHPVVVIQCGCRGAEDTTRLAFLERVLRSWSMTMRLALLVLLLAGMAVLTVALGFVR